jgi:hypothetical protein
MMRCVKPPVKGSPPGTSAPPGARRNDEKARPVQGKTFILALLGALVLVVGGVFWIGMHGGSTHVPLSRPGVGFTADDAGAPSASATGRADEAAPAFDGGAIVTTVNDRKVRDELRKRILAGWAAGPDPEVAAAAKAGRFVPAEAGDGGGRMDPKYIQEVVRSELFPMAKKCYEELLTRKQNAKGRMEMSFTIVADEKLGGIVEDADANHGDGGLADEKMTTCMRESLSTLAFRPPAQGGYVTVVYPISFSNDDDEPDAKP